MAGDWIWHPQSKRICISLGNMEFFLPWAQAMMCTLDGNVYSCSVFGARCLLPLPASASPVLGPATFNHYLDREKNKKNVPSAIIWTNSCLSPLFSALQVSWTLWKDPTCHPFRELPETFQLFPMLYWTQQPKPLHWPCSFTDLDLLPSLLLGLHRAAVTCCLLGTGQKSKKTTWFCFPGPVFCVTVLGSWVDSAEVSCTSVTQKSCILPPSRSGLSWVEWFCCLHV